MKIETFKKRFDYPEDALKYILDGNTTYMMTSGKNGKLYEITFNKKGLPVAKKYKQPDAYNRVLRECIQRNIADTEKAEKTIGNYLQKKWGGKKIKFNLN